MEIAIPGVALGLLYIVSNQKRKTLEIVIYYQILIYQTVIILVNFL
jgi:hypothetical protein